MSTYREKSRERQIALLKKKKNRGIERSRKKDAERGTWRNTGRCGEGMGEEAPRKGIYIYLPINIHMHSYVHIYTYIHIH